MVNINYEKLYNDEKNKRESIEKLLKNKNTELEEIRNKIKEIKKKLNKVISSQINKTNITNIKYDKINKKENLQINQSQKHGFTFENEIRTKVFKLDPEVNDRNIHDIPHEKNKLVSNENISIKTTGSDIIHCGDISRFYKYDFNKRNIMIIIKYIQDKEYKTIKNIYEIDYNSECHKMLFGNLPEDELYSYVKNVKSIPTNVKGDDAKKIYNYLDEKKKLSKKYNNIIQINPKVDSKQSRVQCSIKNFEDTLKQFIIYKSPIDCPNIIRDIPIIKSIYSNKRHRNKIK